MGPWDDFLIKLQARFEDHIYTRKIHEKLEHFSQGQLPVDKYMNQFETIITDVRLNGVESEKIQLLKKATKLNIINVIYSCGTLPHGFDGCGEQGHF
jgi:Retrotransposon gag protein